MSKKLPVLDPLATFVDVGSEHMHVSVGGDAPKVFGTVTSQLNALRDWLLEQGVHCVAMEATGVYWLPLYNVLEQAGMEVRMINGKQTRNLPGRKTDMADCQWGATLHMHGLLRAGFVPPADIRPLALTRIDPRLPTKIDPPRCLGCAYSRDLMVRSSAMLPFTAY